MFYLDIIRLHHRNNKQFSVKVFRKYYCENNPSLKVVETCLEVTEYKVYYFQNIKAADNLAHFTPMFYFCTPRLE